MIDPDDVDTTPDLATFPCPYCEGEGVKLDVLEGETWFQARAVRCPECRGGKIVNREQMARWQAERRR